MDFLPVPDTAHDPVLVPDLGGPEYDGGSFEDYGTREGWDMFKLRRADMRGVREKPGSKDLSQDLETQQAMQFIQTWLLYGTLSEIMGRRVARSEYSTGKYITTRSLGIRLRERRERIARMPLEEREREMLKIRDCLNHGSKFLHDFSFHEEQNSARLLPEEIHLSFTILFYYLSFGAVTGHAVVFAYDRGNDAFRNKLVKNGWCISLTERLVRAMGPPGLYYGSQLGLNKDSKSHSGCFRQRCTALTVDEDSYITQHTQLGCHCAHLGPRSTIHPDVAGKTLQSLLKSGIVPLIDLSLDLGGAATPELEIVPRDSSSQYVAISHVWADGLGNPDSNTLPRCQLDFLKERVKEALVQCKLEPSELVWIDTLCVPLQPPSRRNAAIGLMRTTYQSAQAVLVLDATLMAVKAPLRTEEALVRIMCSNWMTRLWTLQEAALASRLVFQFADRVLVYRDLLKAAEKESSNFEKLFLSHRASVALTKAISITTSENKGEPYAQLSSLWTSLRWRSASHERDVPICIATLIGLDVRGLLEKSAERDLAEAFWSCLKNIPVNILWLSGPKMTTSSFRWAPRYLLDPETLDGSLDLSLPTPGIPPARYTNWGLMVEGLPGYWLHDAWFPREEGETFDFIHPGTKQTYYVSKAGTSVDIPWERIGLHKRQQKTAMLLGDLLTPHESINGVLLAEYTTFGGVIRTQWLACVRVYAQGSIFHDIQRTRQHMKRRVYAREGHAAAQDSDTGAVKDAWVEEVDVKQKWCIS